MISLFLCDDDRQSFTLLFPVFEMSHACDPVFPEFEDLFESLLFGLRLRQLFYDLDS